jgi:hypothetical protein
LQVALFEQQSVAFQVRVMVLVQPEILVTVPAMTTLTFWQQASETVGGVKFHWLPHWTVKLLAQVNSGGTVSIMVT